MDRPETVTDLTDAGPANITAGSGFDPGWCFLCAGLALLGAALLVPAWRDVEQLRSQVDVLQHQVDHARSRDRTGRALLEALRSDDPEVYKRLVAWQWNLVPLGDEAVIRERHDGGITGWVEARTLVPEHPAPVPEVSMLEQVLEGPVRPWMLAGGGLCLLVGVVVLPMQRAAHDTTLQAGRSPG